MPRSALGLEHVSLEPFHVTIAGGEHVLVVGTPRSGRTTVLERLRDGWLSARPDGAVWSADGVAELAAVLAGGDRAPHLLAIDDADHIDDEAGHLARLIALGHRGLNIVAAVRPDLARGRFGHWTSALARHRTGIVMTAASADADLVGVVEALRSPIDPRPGLAWVIHGGRSTLVQVAAGTRESSRDRPLRAKVRSASPGRSAAERDADLGGGQRTTGQGVPAQPYENESPISATTTPACR